MAWNTNLATVPDASNGRHVLAGDKATESVRVLIVGSGVSPGSSIPVQEVRPATSSVTSVAASGTNVTLLASNANRIGASFFNDSTVACYVKLGATASTSSFTVKVFGAGYFVLAFPSYTGQVDALWDSATGNMRITELTA